MSARKRIKVTRDGKTLTVYPYRGGWRYGWREHESAPWRYVTRKTQAEAKLAAWDTLGELAGGGLVWSGLSAEAKRFHGELHRLVRPGDYDALIALVRSRSRSAEIVASVGRFIDWKIADTGEETRHIRNVRNFLEPMAASFEGRAVVDISLPDLEGWFKGRTAAVGNKTSNDIRSALVMFWNWCIREGIHPKESTPPDKLPAPEPEKMERRILTHQELLDVLNNVKEEFRAWVVLGAFCGLRPEEIAPPRAPGMSKKSKRGIRCEEIDWTFKVINLPEEVSKVPFPRRVPLSEAALAWLEWAGIRPGMTGPVCRRNPPEEGETSRLGKLLFGGRWPQDVLRHSAASYRNAILRNLPQLAEEMGTSVDMLNRHYHNPQARELGEAWFSLRPGMIRFDPISANPDSLAEDSGLAANA